MKMKKKGKTQENRKEKKEMKRERRVVRKVLNADWKNMKRSNIQQSCNDSLNTLTSNIWAE